MNLPCCALVTDALCAQEIVDYSDVTQNVSRVCNLHKLQLTFAIQKLKFYTLATLEQHKKQFKGFASMQPRHLLV